jgi:diketogulonate reductase-like aldo/keto reductase
MDYPALSHSLGTARSAEGQVAARRGFIRIEEIPARFHGLFRSAGLTPACGATGRSSDSEAILSRYLEDGGNFIDTANIYTRGHSEKIIGDFSRSGDRTEQTMSALEDLVRRAT